MFRWKQLMVWISLVGCLLIAVISFISAVSRIGEPFPGFLIGKGRNVYPVSGFDWSFKTARMRARDRILSVNGHAIDTHHDFEKAIQAAKPNSEIRYIASRKGKKYTFTTRLREFTLSDCFISFGFFFIIGLFFLVSGFTVFYLKSSLPAARVFAFFCSTMGISFITLFDAYSSMRLIFFLDVSLYLVPALMIHLACLFPSPFSFVIKRKYVIPLVYFVFLVIWQVKSAFEIHNYPAWEIIDYIGDLLIFGAYLFFVLALYFRSKRERTQLLKKRAQIALVGVGLAFTLPGIALITGLSNGALPLNFSFLTCLIFPLYLGYAIIRHNFFNAEKIVVNTIFYLLYLFLLIFVFIGVSTFSGMLFQNTSSSKMMSAIFFTIFILLFSRVQVYLRSLIDRLFFRFKTEKSKNFFEVARFIRKINRLSSEVIPVIEKIFNTLGINKAAILLRTTKGFRSFCAFTFQDASYIRSSGDTITFIENRAEILTPYDLYEAPVPETVRDNLETIFVHYPSMLLMPIMLENSLIGCMMVGERPDGHSFQESDLEILMNLSNQLAIASENSRLLRQVGKQERIEKELEIAANIQRHFLPREVIENTWYTAAFHYHAAREVGGDIYDFFQDSTDCLGVITGDVSGKGIPAALFGAVSSGIIKAGWEKNISPGRFLKQVNKQLFRIKSDKLNIALSYGLFDRKTAMLFYSNRGLPFPIMIRKKAKYLISGGLPLAIKKNAPSREIRIKFQKGDIFIFYSDGIVESRNRHGEILGFDRLLALCSEVIDKNPEDSITYLIKRIEEFTEGSALEDDRILQIICIQS